MNDYNGQDQAWSEATPAPVAHHEPVGPQWHGVQLSGTAEPATEHRADPHVLNQFGRGGGQYNQAVNLTAYYMSSDFVRLLPIDSKELEVCAEGRYLPPREAGQLAAAEQQLDTSGLTVLCAPPGTGRRTTALKLLEKELGSERLYALKLEWSAPDSSLLPEAPGGYLLDLSGLDEDERDPEFTKGLLAYGRAGLQAGRRLVMLVTPSDWTGSWAEGLPVVRLTSPDARQVVERELGGSPNVGMPDSNPERDWTLDDELFREVWTSNPGLADARLLASDLRVAKRADLQDIVAKFTGWRSHIEDMLNEPGGTSTDVLLGRATIWSAALLNGSSYQTIFAAADRLLGKLGIERAPAAILAGPTATKRLSFASLTLDTGRAWHDRNKHDLPAAILEQFWDEYPNNHDELVSWAVDLTSSQDLTPDEVNTAITALLTLARRRQEASILDEIGDALTGIGQEAAVKAITTAALDPEFGDYVKHRLLRWSKATTGARPRLVALVAGGEFGAKEPTAALIRLRWAAASLVVGDDRRIIVEAFRALVTSRPGEVERALRGWLRDTKPQWASCAAILAVGSSTEGARAVFALAGDSEVRPSLVAAWQTLVRDGRTTSLVNERLDAWDSLIGSGELKLDALLPVLVEVYEPEVERARISGFVRNVVDPEDLRDHIARGILHRSWQRHHSQTAE